MANLIPLRYIKIISGIVFILFGIVSLIKAKQEEAEGKLKNPFFTSFLIVLVSEMGDKTQIASGLFAAKFHPVLVFLGVITALTLLSVMAIYLGKNILHKLNRKLVSRIAGVLFILIGVYCFF